MVGVAVKVTLVPEQMLLEEAPIETLTGSNGLIIILIVFDVAGLLLEHVRSEVNTQPTASLFTGI